MATPKSRRPGSVLRRGPARTLVLLVSVLVAVPGLLSTPTASSQEPTERHGIFIDTIDVSLINIEVVAVDKQGNPVTGLTRDDFEVSVDGRPIEITNFFAVEGGERVRLVKVDEEAGVGPTGAAAGADDVLATGAAEDLHHIVLFIDNRNIAPTHRKRIFGELREHMDHLMQPMARVMVATQDGEVRVEQPFTSDSEQVLATINRLEKSAGKPSMLAVLPSTIQRKIELRQSPPCGDPIGAGGENPPENEVVGGIPAGPAEAPTYPNDARETFGDVSQYALEMKAATNESLQALARFVRSLAGIPGRKAIVYVSDGLNLAAGEHLFRIWDYKYGCIASEVGIANIEAEITQYQLYDDLQDLIVLASANRVAFYTVEGGSDRGLGDISAETSVGPTVQVLARTADGGREESLRALAHDTGGVPLLNSGSVDHLLTLLARDFENYYSLGFPSPHRGDGKRHRVRIEVKRDGVQTRFVESYRDKSAEERMTDQTLASLLHDVGENPLDVQVEIGKESRIKGKKGYVVPLLVKVPMSKLMLLPEDDEHLGRLSIYIAVADDRGRLSEPQKIDVPVRIPNQQLLGALSQTAAYAAQIRMRPGEQKLAVGVRDEVAAVGSTLNLNIEVGGG